MKKILISILLVAAMLLSMTACDTNDETPSNGETGEPEEVTITIWRGQGTDSEEALYNSQIQKFNEQSDYITVEYEVFPYDDFGTTVRSALATDSLPDIVYVDGTEVGNLVFLGALTDIDEYLENDFVSKYVDSAFYKIDNKTYGLAQQDGGLAFWANKSMLEQAGVRIATYENPWTQAEFVEACEKLSELDEVDYVIDMKTNWGGGYVVYAWQPFIVSAGGDWYNHDTLRATGALNSNDTIEALEFMKSLYTKGFVDANQTSDTFIVGQSALELTGHWTYSEYSQELGDDLVLIPLPDLGQGSNTGIGGLPFAVTTQAVENGTVEESVEFIKFALGEEFQLQINDANGSMPVLESAFEQVDNLKEGGPLYLYAQQLAGGRYAIRPMSPAFPTYQNEVGKAVMDILAGEDVEDALNAAATAIDTVIEESGY